jgi:hypothetical protein
MKKNQILISIRIKHVSAARAYHCHQPLSFNGSCQAQKKFAISSAHSKYKKKSWMKYNGGNSFQSSPSSTLLPHFPPWLHPQPPHLSPSPTNQTKTSKNGAKDGSCRTTPSRDFRFDTSMYAMASSGLHGRPAATRPFTVHAEGSAAGTSFLMAPPSSNPFDLLPLAWILDEDDEAREAGTRVSRRCGGAGMHAEGAKQDPSVGFPLIARGK